MQWAPGMSVGIHAAAAPGAELKFVWQKDSWSKWGTAQAASTETSCTWKPSSSGKYEIYVDVTVGGLSATETLSVSIAEDFSLDGLSAEASDGGAPLLGDECKLGLSVSGNSGSLAYKFVWEQGGWARWARSARATRPPRAPGSPRSPATLISGLTPSTRTVGLPPASSRCTWRIIWKISTRYPLSLLMA